jgi:hypothetical protein
MAYPKGGPKVGGRQKGTPNKATAAIKEMIIAALDQAGGVEYLVGQSETNPTAFMGLVGRVLPLQVNGPGEAGEHLHRIDHHVVDRRAETYAAFQRVDPKS